MTKAIAHSLPNTFHRYCSWHILEKFSTYLNVITYRDFYKDFRQCIWESECPEEFERKWVTIIEKASLYDNDWLRSIFEMHNRWVPTYVNHIFSAGMSSSQRAESSHAFFKKYVLKKNLLMDFILRFNKVLAHQCHEELAADHVDINEKPILKSLLEMEKQMAEIYTCKIFLKFQDELWQSLVTMPQLVHENDTHKMYTIDRGPHDDVLRAQEISYDKGLNYVSCSCKKFESQGIPCRYILVFLRLCGNIPLPNKHIMKRWTRVAKFQMISDKQGVKVSGMGSSMLMWQAKLFQIASKVIDKAITNEESSVIVNDSLKGLLEKLNSLGGSKKSGDMFGKDSNVYDTALKDPSQVRANGCGQRLKMGKEIAIKIAKYRGRHCNGCGKIGESHDKRNCPILNSPHKLGIFLHKHRRLNHNVTVLLQQVNIRELRDDPRV
ncbi:protein FAR-RED IMPAIRED RESPONSE 1-like [Ziziphus jujuba]|uniref:Protein FAR1-RELATED SEQUENCE n=1 Tax=Ziziphus jujuba TaxID=326968 RepID=A0ABM4ACQ5_ZIZJJ|nr:protein FAR-RED IMPAIRED RESPONSE 1-like [Ziziphus jujuba]